MRPTRNPSPVAQVPIIPIARVERLQLADPEDIYALLCSFAFTPCEVGPAAKQLKREVLYNINKYRILDICRLESFPNMQRLTICNLWRLEKYNNSPQIHLLEYNLAQDAWQEKIPDEINWDYVGQPVGPKFLPHLWPRIFCLSFCTPSIPLGNLAHAILNKIVLECGLTGLCAANYEAAQSYRKGLYNSLVAVLANADTVHFRPRRLRKHLWESFLDRELMSFLASKNHRASIMLPAYLAALPYKEALGRIAQESRNVMPILSLIAPKFWPRLDLLNDAVLLKAAPALADCSHADLRWIKKAPCSVLSKLYYRQNIQKVVSFMRDLQITGKVPALVLRHIVKHSWRALYISQQNEGCRPQLLCLYRQYALHCLDNKKSKNKKKARWTMPAADLVNVLDWFLEEGLMRGLPDKNATWASIKRMSKAWHAAQVQDSPESALLINAPAWESPLEECIFGSVRVTPLNTVKKLKDEGKAMQHCVGSYAKRCIVNGCRVFSLQANECERSTLSLMQAGDDWLIEQHRGHANSRVSSPALKAAAKEVLKTLRGKILLK